jgi:hypothetical protein
MKLDSEMCGEKVDGCIWDTINGSDKVPESYYMKEKFQEHVGP